MTVVWKSTEKKKEKVLLSKVHLVAGVLSRLVKGSGYQTSKSLCRLGVSLVLRARILGLPSLKGNRLNVNSD